MLFPVSDCSHQLIFYIFKNNGALIKKSQYLIHKVQLNNVSYWQTTFTKSWKMKHYNGKIEEGLKILRSSKMFDHKEMETQNFTFAQVCSSGCMSSQHSTSPFMEAMEYIGCHG